MRVSQETFTVLADSTLREVSVLLAGMRISLTPDEARSMAGELSKCVQHLAQSGKSRNDAATPADADIRQFKDEIKLNPGFPRTA